MYQKTRLDVKKLTVSALCLALCLLLPFLTGQIQQIGNMLLPMHLPVLLCAFLCGAPYGALIGFAAPFLRFMLFHMPPLMPTGTAMTFELCAYGIAAGFCYQRLPKKLSSVYISLIFAMLFGRLVWGVVSLLLHAALGTPFTAEMFFAGAVLNAVPGILLQLIVLPPLVQALKRSV